MDPDSLKPTRRGAAGTGTPGDSRLPHGVRVAIACTAACVASLTAIVVLLPLLLRALVRLLLLAVDGCVWLAAALSTGVEPWSVATSVVHAVSAGLASPNLSLLLVAAATLSALAFYGLQRLLGAGAAR